MSITSQSRAGDVRALLGAITLGSGMGLAIGAAYLLGGLDRMSGIKAAPAAAPAMMAASAPSASTNSPALRQVASAPTQFAAAPTTLRARFHLPTLRPVVARPFRLAGAPDNADLNCLTQAVYYEARGEPKDGQRAVAQVVLNRVRHPAFPKTICGVVHQRSSAGCQFTFACSKVVANPIDDDAWRKAQAVASRALHGGVMASIGEATHFQTVRSGAFAGLLKVAQIGAHAFYRFAGHAGSDSMFHQAPAPSQGSVMTAELKGDAKARVTAHVVVASLGPSQEPPQASALQVEHAAEAAIQAKSAAPAQAAPAPADKAPAATKTASAA